MEIDLSCAIFLKRILFEDLKNNVPRCLTSKYTNTNTQIHKYTNTVWAKIINNNIIIIIQLQKQIPELCSKQLLFFWFDIHNNMFPNIVKKVFLKKIEKFKCYKRSSSDHQQQHHHHQTTKAVGDDISSKLLFLHSSQQVGVQILLVQPHSKTSKQRKTHPHKIICVQYLQQCKMLQGSCLCLKQSQDDKRLKRKRV